MRGIWSLQLCLVAGTWLTGLAAAQEILPAPPDAPVILDSQPAPGDAKPGDAKPGEAK